MHTFELLSKKEQQITKHVAAGLKNVEIGHEVGTTEHVIKNYLRVIYDKLGFWNRVELALWYVANVEGPLLSGQLTLEFQGD